MDKETNVVGMAEPVRYTSKYFKPSKADMRTKGALYLMVKYRLSPKMARKVKTLMAGQELPCHHVLTRRRLRRAKKERERATT